MFLSYRANAEGALRIFKSGNRSGTVHGAAANGTPALDDRGLFIPGYDGDGVRLRTTWRAATEAEYFVWLACLAAALLAILEPSLQVITGDQKGPTVHETR